jgi:Domain of unknown function (DUF4148)
MKTNHLFTAIALTLAAAAGPVLAQEATYEYPQPAVSQTTRAAVLAELKALRADGHSLVSEANVGIEDRFLPQRSREAVRAEARAAAKSGLTQALIAEPHDFTVAMEPAAAPAKVAAK